MVLIIALVGLFAISVALWCTVPLLDQNDPHNLLQITTQIDRICTEENAVYLYTDTGILGVSNDLICNYSVLEKSVANNVEFQILFMPFSESQEVKGEVWELVDSKGIIYVAEETTRAYQKANDRIVAKASWLIVVVYSIFTFCLWYFLSNATKYPRVAALFVRKEWRNF